MGFSCCWEPRVGLFHSLAADVVFRFSIIACPSPAPPPVKDFSPSGAEWLFHSQVTNQTSLCCSWAHPNGEEGKPKQNETKSQCHRNMSTSLIPPLEKKEHSQMTKIVRSSSENPSIHRKVTSFEIPIFLKPWLLARCPKVTLSDECLTWNSLVLLTSNALLLMMI